MPVESLVPFGGILLLEILRDREVATRTHQVVVRGAIDLHYSQVGLVPVDAVLRRGIRDSLLGVVPHLEDVVLCVEVNGIAEDAGQPSLPGAIPLQHGILIAFRWRLDDAFEARHSVDEMIVNKELVF